MPSPEVKISGKVEFPPTCATLVAALAIPRIAYTNLYTTENMTVDFFPHVGWKTKKSRVLFDVAGAGLRKSMHGECKHVNTTTDASTYIVSQSSAS